MRLTITFLIVFLNCVIANGQLIIDNGEFFSDSEKIKLKNRMEEIYNSTTNQILLYTAMDLNGESPKEFGLKLSMKYPMGIKGVNNGILILLSKNDRNLQLLNGNGLEWILTDDESGVIVKEMVQFLKKKDYYKGIDTALYLINDQVSKYDWKVRETKHGWITKDDKGKIVKFLYSNKTGMTSFKYLIETDPQFSDDYSLTIEVNDTKYKLFYTKYMNDLVSKILNKKEVIIYARLKDWNNKQLELLGIE